MEQIETVANILGDWWALDSCDMDWMTEYSSSPEVLKSICESKKTEFAQLGKSIAERCNPHYVPYFQLKEVY